MRPQSHRNGGGSRRGGGNISDHDFTLSLKLFLLSAVAEGYNYNPISLIQFSDWFIVPGYEGWVLDSEP